MGLDWTDLLILFITAILATAHAGLILTLR